MSINYKGLINGHLNPLDIAKLLQKHYGGDNYSVHFTSDLTPGFYYIHFRENLPLDKRDLKGRELMVARKDLRTRMMAVFTDGECASDYSDLTTKPMTYISLGHSGDCQEIIDALVLAVGGYVYDELGPKETTEEWVRLEVAMAAREKVAQSA